MTTTVKDNNVVIIPDAIARAFNIHAGTKLEWTQATDGVIAVKPLSSRGELARQLLGAGRRFLKSGDNPIASLIHERDQDDEMDRADERP
jgi:AbrB family looped-hinge helix DNA binding protein